MMTAWLMPTPDVAMVTQPHAHKKLAPASAPQAGLRQLAEGVALVHALVLQLQR